MAWSSMAESSRPLVALVGAVTAAIAPAVQALTLEFPEARAWNVIDDMLIADAIAAGGLTGGLRSRMARLIQYALDGGADGVLLTCSMYGPVAHDVAASVTVPVLAADDAAFEAAVASGFSRVALVSSLPVPLADALERFGSFVEARQDGPEFAGVLAEGAYDASVAGDTEALARALAAAVLGTGVDGILLAQYSLAPASERLAALTSLPVLTGPGRSARALRAALLRSAS
jgi:hypothetical protein